MAASLIVALSVAVLVIQTPRADNPAALGFLELDGNVVPGNCVGPNCESGTGTCASPISSSSVTDWACLFTQVSTFTGSTSPTAAQISSAYVSNGLPLHAVASSFVPNGYSGGPLCPTSKGSSCPYPTTFTSGSKDILDVSANTCASSNSLLAKDALVNTYGIKYINTATGHQIAYIGDEKISNGGDNNIGVWFDSNPISVPSSPCPTGSGAPFIGTHAYGDILTVSNFTKGGTLAGVNAYRWVGTGTCTDGSSGPLCLQFSGNVCDSSGLSTQYVCGIVSHVITAGVPDGSTTGNICGFPWVTNSKELGGMNNTLSALHCTAVNSFYEMGIDLTALGFTSCRTNALPETRSSQSLTATLFDFTILNLNSCATSTSTTSSQTGIVAPGTPVTDTATVTSTSVGGGTPTGTVQFYFCGPTTSATSCAITPANAVGTPVTLSGGSATSGAQSPVKVGFYCWSAAYIPNNSFLPSQSNATTNECFHVVAPTTTTTTSSSTGTVLPGTAVTDTATVAAVPASAGTPTGTVQFYFCGPTTTATTCAITSGNAVGSPVTLVGGSATSGAQSPVKVGFYCWSALYTPDTNNFIQSNSTTTAKECFQVVAPTTTTTTSSTTSLTIVPGTSETDSVTVAAVPTSAGTPTGTVQFYVCGPTTTAASCATVPANALGSPKTLSGGAATSDAINGASTPVTDNVPGFYCFSAVYTPDTTNFLTSGSTTTTNECFQVVNSIPKVTSFIGLNTPDNNDPTLGKGTEFYNVTVTNFANTQVTITGTLKVTTTGTPTVTCTGGNTLSFSATLQPGQSKSFTLSCHYSGSTGDTVSATFNATFTDVSGSGIVSGSPETLTFTVQTKL